MGQDFYSVFDSFLPIRDIIHGWDEAVIIKLLLLLAGDLRAQISSLYPSSDSHSGWTRTETDAKY